MQLGKYWVANLGTYILISMVSWMWGTWFMMEDKYAFSTDTLTYFIGISFIPAIWHLTMKRFYDFLSKIFVKQSKPEVE